MTFRVSKRCPHFWAWGKEMRITKQYTVYDCDLCHLTKEIVHSFLYALLIQWLKDKITGHAPDSGKQNIKQVGSHTSISNKYQGIHSYL